MKRKKPIPIGVEFYKQMIEDGYYYIDKTLLIRDILEQKSMVTLFTRPRRFGKTLAQSMLKTFFEKEMLPDGTVADNSVYFQGKKIMAAGEEYTKHMGQYPVIFLSLKSAKQPTYEIAYKILQQNIAKEFIRHSYILNSEVLLPVQKICFNSFIEQKAEPPDYATSIQFLSECLEKYHKQKVIILVDEYDVPLENAYFNGFYDEMVSFIRSLFESALKTNESLKFAIVTGCLRISRESIFTGLNNLDVVSVLNEDYAEYFGFTQDETDSFLQAYDIMDRKNEVKNWYDGYLFGNTEVYNPWSLINYVKDICHKNTEFPKPYWSNTSSNSIVHKLIEKSDDNTKNELEGLVAGGTIEKPVHEDITYEDIYKSQDNLWNFLFFTGYLKAVNKRFEDDIIYLVLKIPNREIRSVYRNKITEWFNNRIKTADFSGLYKAVISGDTKIFEDYLREQLHGSISFMDSAENFYHGFLLGILTGLQGYEKLSNRESGEGRYDIVLKPYDERQPAIILELKRVQRFTEMESMCQEALQQIEDKHYDAGLLDEGYMVIKKYGICFCKKSCMVMIKE
ncbi:MAG: AAA family ATPase [Lachnospiraceae bacterium]|nr:AAA family ATPase [Lachnospiraceae bacterium]